MKKIFFNLVLAASAMIVVSSCCKNDDYNPSALIPDSEAGITPDASPLRTDVTIPGLGDASAEEGSDGAIGNMTIAGVKVDNSYMDFVGTDGASNGKDQNVWLEIDGKAKTAILLKAQDAAVQAKTDIVFLVDDSGTMSEEADAIASQIKTWAQELAGAVDCRFGIVGYGNGSTGIDGAINMTTVDNIISYLNAGSGTSRTQHFGGTDAATLQNIAQTGTKYNNGSWHECGCLALHFADEQFSFRSGSNRIYINFTDEPTQPNGYQAFSIETLHNTEGNDLYNWGSSHGTVHTVYSNGGVEADYTNWYPTVESPKFYDEEPWKMSDWTGGTKSFTNSTFSGFTLDDIPVTSSILHSYIIRFNRTSDLTDGQLHDVKLVIKVDGVSYTVWTGQVRFN